MANVYRKYTDVTLEIQQDRPLASLNTLGLRVTAERYATAGSEAEVCEALSLARQNDWRVTILGGGSNVVFTDDVPGMVLHVCTPGILYDGERVEAGAGEEWHHLVLSSIEQGLSGIENLSLIPGSVGAAPIQNIGAYGGELADVFVSLTAVDRQTLATVEMDEKDCRFGYRYSVFKDGLRDRMVITRLRLRLRHEFVPNLAYEELRAEVEKSGMPLTAAVVSETVCAIRRRKLPDPAAIGNVGSFFKNPEVTAERLAELVHRYPQLPHWRTESGTKVSAAWLIDKCGLKGKQLGGAAVSSQHALVLVNRKGATGEDILSLARAVQEEVRHRFDLALEIEPVVY